MDYRILLQEENDAVRERYELSMERIRSMETEQMQLPYGSYFKKVSAFIGQIEGVVERRLLEVSAGEEEGISLSAEALQEENHALYRDILPDHYGESYANPDYGVRELGDGYGQLLSFLYTEIRADIVYASEMRLMNITILNELFLEVYNLFAQAWQEGQKRPQEQLIKDSLYWFVSDYAELTVDWRVREGVDPSLSFGTDIVMESDLEDLRYLYAYGEYVSDTERSLASFMNRLPQETIDRMASTYTEGFRKGFEVMGRDLKKKKTVVVEFQLGFERMVRKAMENFREMGLEPICYRAAVESVNRRANGRRGYYGTSPNKQYDYDHRYDSALYMGNAFKERKLAVLRAAYETYKKEASWCAGPALVETFGEEGFSPVNKKTALALNAHQEELSAAYANESRQAVNQYMPGDETSFTIIAFPKPEIGPDFEEIFKETIRINTLDYEKYQKIQQCIILALDEADHVLITGRCGNETAMKVKLHHLKDREKETNFENCVSDVNIPLGEVFTSPVLAGTEGLLHVKNVYVEDYQFKNLRMVFKDGKAVEYSCGNFESSGSCGTVGNETVSERAAEAEREVKAEGAVGAVRAVESVESVEAAEAVEAETAVKADEAVKSADVVGAVGAEGDVNADKAADAQAQGRALVKQVIMHNHDQLPLGEFAIGTNTTAYAMAKRFSIGEKLPILIAEKMGPHFAVGDTCYSFAEDSPMYNPDGREVIARDNEISLLRKTDISGAYFSCHTDITIPYSELGDIKAVRADGSRIDIICHGRFVLEGTEELNEALDEADKMMS